MGENCFFRIIEKLLNKKLPVFHHSWRSIIVTQLEKLETEKEKFSDLAQIGYIIAGVCKTWLGSVEVQDTDHLWLSQQYFELFIELRAQILEACKGG